MKGPWSAAADTFWRAIARQTAGENIDYILGPAGNTAGLTKYLGTCTALHYEHDEVSAEGVMTYTARLSILAKTTTTF